MDAAQSVSSPSPKRRATPQQQEKEEGFASPRYPIETFFTEGTHRWAYAVLRLPPFDDKTFLSTSSSSLATIHEHLRIVFNAPSSPTPAAAAPSPTSKRKSSADRQHQRTSSSSSSFAIVKAKLSALPCPIITNIAMLKAAYREQALLTHPDRHVPPAAPAVAVAAVVGNGDEENNKNQNMKNNTNASDVKQGTSSSASNCDRGGSSSSHSSDYHHNRFLMVQKAYECSLKFAEKMIDDSSTAGGGRGGGDYSQDRTPPDGGATTPTDANYFYSTTSSPLFSSASSSSFMTAEDKMAAFESKLEEKLRAQRAEASAEWKRRKEKEREREREKDWRTTSTTRQPFRRRESSFSGSDVMGARPSSSCSSTASAAAKGAATTTTSAAGGKKGSRVCTPTTAAAATSSSSLRTSAQTDALANEILKNLKTFKGRGAGGGQQRDGEVFLGQHGDDGDAKNEKEAAAAGNMACAEGGDEKEEERNRVPTNAECFTTTTTTPTHSRVGSGSGSATATSHSHSYAMNSNSSSAVPSPTKRNAPPPPPLHPPTSSSSSSPAKMKEGNKAMHTNLPTPNNSALFSSSSPSSGGFQQHQQQQGVASYTVVNPFIVMPDGVNRLRRNSFTASGDIPSVSRRSRPPSPVASSPTKTTATVVKQEDGNGSLMRQNNDTAPQNIPDEEATTLLSSQQARSVASPSSTLAAADVVASLNAAFESVPSASAQQQQHALGSNTTTSTTAGPPAAAYAFVRPKGWASRNTTPSSSRTQSPNRHVVTDQQHTTTNTTITNNRVVHQKLSRRIETPPPPPMALPHHCIPTASSHTTAVNARRTASHEQCAVNEKDGGVSGELVPSPSPLAAARRAAPPPSATSSAVSLAFPPSSHSSVEGSSSGRRAAGGRRGGGIPASAFLQGAFTMGNSHNQTAMMANGPASSSTLASRSAAPLPSSSSSSSPPSYRTRSPNAVMARLNTALSGSADVGAGAGGGARRAATIVKDRGSPSPKSSSLPRNSAPSFSSTAKRSTDQTVSRSPPSSHVPPPPPSHRPPSPPPPRNNNHHDSPSPVSKKGGGGAVIKRVLPVSASQPMMIKGGGLESGGGVQEEVRGEIEAVGFAGIEADGEGEGEGRGAEGGASNGAPLSSTQTVPHAMQQPATTPTPTPTNGVHVITTVSVNQPLPLKGRPLRTDGGGGSSVIEVGPVVKTSTSAAVMSNVSHHGLHSSSYGIGKRAPPAALPQIPQAAVPSPSLSASTAAHLTDAATAARWSLTGTEYQHNNAATAHTGTDNIIGSPERERCQPNLKMQNRATSAEGGEEAGGRSSEKAKRPSGVDGNDRNDLSLSAAAAAGRGKERRSVSPSSPTPHRPPTTSDGLPANDDGGGGNTAATRGGASPSTKKSSKKSKGPHNQHIDPADLKGSSLVSCAPLQTQPTMSRMAEVKRALTVLNSSGGVVGAGVGRLNTSVAGASSHFTSAPTAAASVVSVCPSRSLREQQPLEEDADDDAQQSAGNAPPANPMMPCRAVDNGDAACVVEAEGGAKSGDDDSTGFQTVSKATSDHATNEAAQHPLPRSSTPTSSSFTDDNLTAMYTVLTAECAARGAIVLSYHKDRLRCVEGDPIVLLEAQSEVFERSAIASEEGWARECLWLMRGQCVIGDC